MDENDLSGNELADFSVVSSSVDSKKMAEKINELEAKLTKIEQANQFGVSMMQIGMQFGEKFGKLENQMKSMKNDMDGLRSENLGLKAEMTKMKEEFGGKTDEKDRQIQEMNEEIGKLGQENVKLREALAGKQMGQNKLMLVPPQPSVNFQQPGKSAGQRVAMQQEEQQKYGEMGQPQGEQMSRNEFTSILNKFKEARGPEEREHILKELKKTPHLFHAFLKMTAKKPGAEL